MFDTAVFIHVAAINNYQQMYDQLFDQIAKSGLLMVVDEVNVCVVAGQELNVIQSPVVKVHYDPDGAYSKELSFKKGEFFTLKKLQEYARSSPVNKKILYCHLRGVTTPNNPHIATWRNYLIHHNITNFRKAYYALDEYDACGVDLITKDRWPNADHFSGNFWWANSDYIKKLPNISDISRPDSETILTLRHNGEFWIGMGGGNLKSMHDVDVDVCSRHLISSPKENYMRD